MAVTQTIDNLLNGVSQAAPDRRDASQATEQINMLSHRERGLRKRPPTVHKAKISGALAGSALDVYDYAFPFFVDHSDTEKYVIVIVDGDLQVFDRETGAAISVLFPFGKAYLEDLTHAGFRAIPAGGTVVVLNRGVKTATDTTQKAPAMIPEALVVVRASDFGTAYSVTINNVKVTYSTPASTTASAEAAKSTDVIAAALHARLAAQFPEFTFTQYGSSVHVVRQDSTEFTLSTADGLGGTALLGIKDSVQSFTDLPARAKDGMVVRVAGAPESAADDYYVQYDDAQGVWHEVVKPGSLIALDKLTMPHVLQFGGSIIDKVPAHRQPIVPITRLGGATSSWLDGFNETSPGSAGLDPLVDHAITNHNQSLMRLLADTDGTHRTVTLTYDIDTTGCDPLNGTITVYAEADAGPATAFTTYGFETYAAGVLLTNQQLTFSASLPINTTARLRLEYSFGSTPGAFTASLNGHGKNNSGGSGVIALTGAGREIVLDPNEIYPHGMTITATVDGIAFAHTVGTIYVGGFWFLVNDESGAEVAGELQRIIDLHATYTATREPQSGVVLVKNVVTGAEPGITIALSGFNTTNTFWNPTTAFVDDEHIGRVIKNLTDGSQGTITDNTGTTVVATLTGGHDNRFDPGDVCSIEGTGTYLVFKPAAWSARAAGDDTSNPMPTFVGRKLDEVYFYANRLGWTALDTVFFSQSGDYFNTFRKTATDLLASDPIDVRSAVRRVAQYHSAVPWHDGLYLLTKSGVIQRVSGSPALTPATVRIDDMGEHPSDVTTRPFLMGERLFIANTKNGYTRVARASLSSTAEGTEALVTKDITKHVSAYMRGSPLSFTGDAESETLVILTDRLDGFGERRVLYVCSFHFVSDTEEEAQQLSWSTWQFAAGARLLSADVINGVVWLLFKRTDGVFLETLTLDPAEFTAPPIGDGTVFGDGSYNGAGLIL